MIPWDTVNTRSEDYFGLKRATAQGLQQPRQDEAREEILPDEEISEGKPPGPQQGSVSADESEDEDRRSLLRQGSPTVKSYWISEGDWTNENCCVRL